MSAPPTIALATLPQINIEVLPVTNFMPPGGESFEFTGGVTIPAIGATAVVVQFTVPNGRNGMIKRIANVFIGGGFTDFSGFVVWQIVQDANQTGPPIVPNYDNITASLGSASNPSPIDGIRIKETQLVQLIVKNVSVVVSGQTIGGRLGGYFYPIDLEPPNIAF
jgi:hypothetical protein